MLDLFTLANARLMLALNHLIASKDALYLAGLFITDKLSDVLTLATFALLWFWPRAKRREYFRPIDEGRLSASSKRKMFSVRGEADVSNELTREESRAQFLVLGMAGTLGYITARLIAFQLDVPRPFATWLPIRAMPGAFEGLRTYGSLPSDHAVLLAALPVALFFWNRKLAWLWLGFSVVLGITRVAVGFHSPLDMAAGALIGVLVTYPALLMYRKRGAFERAMNTLASGFDLSAAPYCYILYFFAFLGALEFAMHFQHILDVLFRFRGEIVARFMR